MSNNSVRDLMKGKSDEDILKDIDKLSTHELLKKSSEYGYLKGVKLALERPIDSSVEYNYAFIIASEKGYTEIVKLLLKHPKVNPSINNNYAILLASQNEHLDVVKLLLQDKRVRRKLSDEKIKKYENQTKGLNESIRDLMKPKSEEEILKSLDNLSLVELLKKSCQSGYVSGVKLALERGVDPSINDNFAIEYASKNGHLEIVKLLLQDERVDPSDHNNYAIRLALQNGHTEIVKLLLQDKRVDPSVDNNYVIRIASLNGYVEIVKLLLQDERVDPSVDNNLTIEFASQNGHTEIVKLLLQDPRVDPTADSNSAINVASQNGHIEIVKLLLQDERVRDKLSKKDLKKYENQIKGLNESIKDLMKPKTDEDILRNLDYNNYSEINKLFVKVIKRGLMSLFNKLLEKGVDVNYRQGEPLINAIKLDRINMVKILLDNGAKTNYSWFEDFLDDYEDTKSYDIVINNKLHESHILKFDDIQNLEFRKGSLQYGDKVKQLIEFLRIYKDQNEDTLIFNKDDFEKASRMKISEIEEINNLPSKKSLMEFNIEITDDQIKFTDLQNRKSIHTESFDPSIRINYEILGVEDFYNKIGGEYKNPHIEDIENCIKKCIGFGFDEFNRTLDLASGTGEITKILMKLGYNNIDIIGCDPYLYREYTMNTNKICLKYSFSDIQQGELDNYKFDTIICSYGMHLADDSILPDMLWRLSMISKFLIIISPNNRPVVKEENGWVLDKFFKIGKSKCKIYISKNL